MAANIVRVMNRVGFKVRNRDKVSGLSIWNMSPKISLNNVII
jgi:hypothetical protein